MGGLKTKRNPANVKAFLKTVKDEQKRADSFALLEMMQEITGEPPMMWGSSIIGFGSYHYRYASGQEGDWMLTGFSPRKQALTLYVMSGFGGDKTHLLKKLGKHSTGKACLYIKRLSDVDPDVLREIVSQGVAEKKRQHVD